MPFAKSGCSRADGKTWGWRVVHMMVCKDAGVSIPSSSTQGAGCSFLQPLTAPQDGRDGEQPYWRLSTPCHALPCHHWPWGTGTKGGRRLLTCMEPVLPLCYPYLEQQPSTNSPRFTKPLRKAIRQINERKAPIKDYQTPSLPGERPGAIHF